MTSAMPVTFRYCFSHAV